jgi:hypothetical protein
METKELDYQELEDTKKLTSAISDYCNNFNYGSQAEYFNEAMSREHRTLQQNFTRLVLRWLEYVASESYRYDARNEDSHIIADDLMREFGKFIESKYGEGASKEPHRWLGTV